MSILPSRRSRDIVLGVTSDMSMVLLRGFPQALVERGWTVHVVSSGGARTDALRGTHGIHVHRIPMARDPHPLHDLVALVRWVWLLARIRPGVVSVGTPKAALLGLVAARVTGVPFRVYLQRGLRLETVSGMLLRILRLMERTTVACSHVVLCVSYSLREKVITMGLVPEHKARVVGHGSSNGVDTNFATEPVNRGLPEPVIGFVGRAVPDKGVDLLVDACNRIAQTGGTGTLLVVGPYEEGDLDVKSRLDPRFALSQTGPVEDARTQYDRMDVLALPTRREGFPNVVLEAAAAGVPTVATSATGVPDAIIDGETGSIVRTREPADLAHALAAVAYDPERRQEMGTRARSRVVRDFDRAGVWAGYAAVYSGGRARVGQTTRSSPPVTSSAGRT